MEQEIDEAEEEPEVMPAGFSDGGAVEDPDGLLELQGWPTSQPGADHSAGPHQLELRPGLELMPELELRLHDCQSPSHTSVAAVFQDLLFPLDSGLAFVEGPDAAEGAPDNAAHFRLVREVDTHEAGAVDLLPDPLEAEILLTFSHQPNAPRNQAWRACGSFARACNGWFFPWF